MVKSYKFLLIMESNVYGNNFPQFLCNSPQKLSKYFKQV